MKNRVSVIVFFLILKPKSELFSQKISCIDELSKDGFFLEFNNYYKNINRIIMHEISKKTNK